MSTWDSANVPYQHLAAVLTLAAQENSRPPLREYRRYDVHRKVKEAWQEVTIVFPKDRPIHGMSWTIILHAPATGKEQSELPPVEEFFSPYQFELRSLTIE